MIKDQEIKEAWVARLENPEAVQGDSWLARETGENCCLGELCWLAVERGVIPAPRLVTVKTLKDNDCVDLGVYVFGAEEEGQLLPKEVQEWAGLDQNPVLQFDPEGYGTQVAYNVTELNDDHGQTFPAIAELIKEQM